MIASLALWFCSHVLFARHQDVSLAGVNLSLPSIGSIQWPSLAFLAVALLCLLKLQWGISRVLLISVLAGGVLFLAGIAG